MDQCAQPKAVANAVKILVTGAYATGKTTLCRLLLARAEAEGIPMAFVTEIPRRCPFALNKDQTTLTSSWLVAEQVRTEIEEGVKSGVLLCDRGIPDILSHTIVLDLTARRDQHLWEGLLAFGEKWCNTYDAILWARVDPNRQIECDGVRLGEREYQIKLERAIERVFGLLGIEPAELPQETPERVEACFRVVRDLLGSKQEVG